MQVNSIKNFDTAKLFQLLKTIYIIFAANMRPAKKHSKIVRYILLLGLIFFTIGVLFKLFHFQNAYPLLLTGLLFPFAAVITLFIIIKQKRE